MRHQQILGIGIYRLCYSFSNGFDGISNARLRC